MDNKTLLDAIRLAQTQHVELVDCLRELQEQENEKVSFPCIGNTPTTPPNCTGAIDCERSQETFVIRRNGQVVSNVLCNQEHTFSNEWVDCNGNRVINEGNIRGMSATVNGGGQNVVFTGADGLSNTYRMTPTSSAEGSIVFNWGVGTSPEDQCTLTLPYACESPPVSNEHPGGVAVPQGYGTASSFGTGGTVRTVTNLNNSGAGSFRDAVTASGTRIVRFSVSGTIDVPSVITITNPNITIEGSTAPGNGIRLQATPGNTGFVLRITTTDVLVENLGIYHNTPPSGSNANNRDTLNISTGSRRVCISQCSMMWGSDETVSAFHDTSQLSDITIQYCLIAEGLSNAGHTSGEHSKGLLVARGIPRATIHHNWFTRNARRNPRFDGDLIQVINNVVISNCDNRFRPLTFGRQLSSVLGRYDIMHNRVYGTDGPARGAIVYAPPSNAASERPTVYSLGNIHDGSRTSNAQAEGVFYGGLTGAQPPYLTFVNSPQISSSPGLCTHTDVSNDDLRDFLLQCVGPHSWNRHPNDARVLAIQPDTVACTDVARQL